MTFGEGLSLNCAPSFDTDPLLDPGVFRQCGHGCKGDSGLF